MKTTLFRILAVLFILAGVVELSLQLLPDSLSPSWSDRPLVTLPPPPPLRHDGKGTEKPLFKVTFLTLADLSQYSVSLDQNFGAIFARMIQTAPVEDATIEPVFQNLTYKFAPSPELPEELTTAAQDLVVLVIDDFWLFKQVHLPEPEKSEAPVLKIASLGTALKFHRNFQEAYSLKMNSRKAQDSWNTLLLNLRRMIGETSLALLIIPRVESIFSRTEFRSHHGQISAAAEEISAMVVDTSDKLSSLPPIRSAVSPFGISDLSEIGHRICGEALYFGLHKSGKLPPSLQIQHAYRSRIDIRLLEELEFPLISTAEVRSHVQRQESDRLNTTSRPGEIQHPLAEPHLASRPQHIQ